ncbi:MAG: MAPEG family protein [Spongiibacter sp.]
MNIPLLCIALLGSLCIGTGFAVSLARAKTNRAAGHSTEPDDYLHKRVRAHGNTVEYTPVLMVIIYIVSQSQMTSWMLWFMVIATICRFLLVAGLILPPTMAKPNPMRFIGALGTYICGFALCAALFMQAM